LLDYQNYSSEYHSLSIKVGNERKGISSFLKNVLRNIEGKSVKEAVYNDVFANEVMSSCKISKG
jgi:hypothetical protein